jgi:hypothetical protein
MIAGLVFGFMPLTCGGAKGTRTPGLLHAMEPQTVRHGSPPFILDRAGLRIRSEQAATVHYRSARTVTSLVTNHTTTLPASNTVPPPTLPRPAAPAQGHRHRAVHIPAPPAHTDRTPPPGHAPARARRGDQ